MALKERVLEKQKQVLQVFVNEYPITTRELQKQVSRLRGEEVTLKSVQRALEQGRNKVRSSLAKKGYAVPAVLGSRNECKQRQEA